MADIRNYITLSEAATAISGFYSIPDDFKTFYNDIDYKERKSLVRHFIVNNVPFAFKDKPMLYEQITQYIADKFDISPPEVKLIGSGKTGFSISPVPNYGKNFGRHSDLDFSIINENLFGYLVDEYSTWSELFRDNQIQPHNQRENTYWQQNLESGERQLRRGFIDTHYIPNREHFPITKKINNSLWLIQNSLDKQHGIRVTKVSASFYRNWSSFAGRLNTNTESVMRSL